MVGERGVRVGGRKMGCIRFADYVVLLTESERTTNAMLEDLNAACEECGIRINAKKTDSAI